MRAYRGHLLHIGGAPRLQQASEHLVSEPNGVLVVDDDGVIAFSGAHSRLPAELAHAELIDCRPGFLLPGFIDTHIHFPQTYCTDSYGGGQLLDWLQRCIFPAETRLADTELARRTARDFCRRRVEVGTTTALVFGSAFPDAQDALFEESLRVGLRTISGRGIQTVGPDAARPLLTDEKAEVVAKAAMLFCKSDVDALTNATIELIENEEGRPANRSAVREAAEKRVQEVVTAHVIRTRGNMLNKRVPPGNSVPSQPSDPASRPSQML